MGKASKWVWVWGAAQEAAWEKLKAELVSYPILRQPDLAKPFYVATDASLVGISGVLQQKDKQGLPFVVRYTSRKLNPAEQNYGVSDREFLAVVYSLDKSRRYLHGTRVTVITDHQPLLRLVQHAGEANSARMVR